jgi:Phosphotransferase enzyme family
VPTAIQRYHLSFLQATALYQPLPGRRTWPRRYFSLVSGDDQPRPIRLSGGFVNEIYLVGDTVRRTAGPWTPAVHSLLRYLEQARFEGVPRVRGFDEQGREVLSHLPGSVPEWSRWPDVLVRGDGVEQLGRFLRRYHDAVAGLRPAPDAIWRNPLAPHTGEVVRHGDFSPFNSVWHANGQLAGIIDWDFAQPGDALTDLAYLARYAAPLAPASQLASYGLPPRLPRAQRLERLCAAYGDVTPSRVIEELIVLIKREISDTAVLGARGIHPWKSFVADGNIGIWQAELTWLEERGHTLLRK